MTRYTSPVNPAVFPHLTVVLLAIGMFFTAWFFVYPPLFVVHNVPKVVLIFRPVVLQDVKDLHASCKQKAKLRNTFFSNILHPD